MSPNTEREYRNALKAAGLLVGDAGALPELEVLKLAIEAHKPAKPPPQHASSVERWREHVEALVSGGAAPKAIFDRLRLEHDEFELAYQAKISLADSRIVGVEALLRWRHPERGLLSHGDFLAVAFFPLDFFLSAA